MRARISGRAPVRAGLPWVGVSSVGASRAAGRRFERIGSGHRKHKGRVRAARGKRTSASKTKSLPSRVGPLTGGGSVPGAPAETSPSMPTRPTSRKTVADRPARRVSSRPATAEGRADTHLHPERQVTRGARAGPLHAGRVTGQRQGQLDSRATCCGCRSAQSSCPGGQGLGGADVNAGAAGYAKRDRTSLRGV